MSKYYHYFSKDITVETVNELVDRLHSEDGEINLFFSTNGGHSPSMSFLVKYFNSIADRLTITLTDDVFSAGIQILTDFKGRIEIDLDEIDALLAHCADRETYNLRKDGSPVNTKILAKQDLEWNKNFAKKLKKKGILNNKQIKDYLKGKDVVLYKKDLKKWKQKKY